MLVTKLHFNGNELFKGKASEGKLRPRCRIRPRNMFNPTQKGSEKTINFSLMWNRGRIFTCTDIRAIYSGLWPKSQGKRLKS